MTRARCSESLHSLPSTDARSRSTIQKFLQKLSDLHYTQEPSRRGENRTEVAEWRTHTNSKFDDFNRKGFWDVTSSYELSKQPSEFPPVINGWQFLGVRQNLSTNPRELVSVTYQEDSEKDPAVIPTAQFLKANFRFNASIPHGPKVVPYNSTLWYNGTEIALRAPFLDLGVERW